MRRWVWAALACAGVAATMVAVTGAGAAGKGRNGLTKSDRALVAKASAEGKSTVTLLIGTQNGQAPSVVGALQALGATVSYRNDALGYAEVQVPTDKADVAAKTAGILTANVDVATRDVVPGRDADATELLPVPAVPGPDNAFMPTRDIGALQFVQAHPTYDGRGVKVGIVDSGVDLDRPELQTALDLNGRTVPKIFDWITATTPRLSDAASGDPTWVTMTAATPSGTSIAIGSKTYTLPAVNNGAAYQVGTFHGADPRLGGELDFVLADTSNEDFGVLENTKTNTVWVDTNQNGSFADEKAMTDYRKNLDVNHFGVDDPSTSFAVESMPFVVQTDTPGLVSIGIISDGHGTHVAGTVAGKGFKLGGDRFDGVAPNAQLAVARVCLFVTGCFTSDQNIAFIRLITEDHVDVIQMSIGGLAPLNDGQSTQELLINRLTKLYGVQFVFSQGNSGPAANTAGSPGTADLAIGTGGYQSQATWTANYGNTPPRQDTMWSFSSRGPREDGGLKPQVIAPGSELSTWPAWDPYSESPVFGVGSRAYELPPGYEMIQGTSMAAPMVTGASALLLSAALQTPSLGHVSPAQLRKALFSSARYLDGYSSYEQGNGLVQVGAAWDILKQNPSVLNIASTAPVSTTLSGFIGNQGVGIYEREGWSVGQTATRTITFTRDSPRDALGDDDLGSSNLDRGNHSGWRNQAATFAVTLKGNDGTFAAPASLTLAPGQSVNLPVTIHPTTAGIHSTLVVLDDPSSPGIEYETEATIIAAGQFTTANNYTVTYTGGHADRAGFQAFFFNVAPGTPAFKVSTAITNGRVRIDATDPWGIPTTAPGYTTGPGTITRTFANPKPGVWEIDIEASRSAVPDVQTFSVTGSELGAAISPTSWNIPTAQQNVGITKAFTFTNLFGDFTGRSSGTVFASAHDETKTIAAGGPQQQVGISVPAGAASLTVSIGNASDPGADLDLYLFDCHTGTCVNAGQGATSSANESVTVANPAAGQWVALIDPFATPSGSTTYDYEDVFPLAGLGTITSDEAASTLHAHGATWTQNITATPKAAPASGRILKGAVQVLSGTTVIGQAPVTVQAVTP